MQTKLKEVEVEIEVETEQERQKRLLDDFFFELKRKDFKDKIIVLGMLMILLKEILILLLKPLIV